VAAVALWYFTFIFPLLIVVAFYLYGQVIKAIRETARIEKLTKSPLVSFFTETIQGTSTIRAFGYSDKFIED